MELKEYIKLIKKHKWLFMGVWLGVIVGAQLWYHTRPIAHDVSMSLEVTRTSTPATEEYQYDQYYRLEADNKFSDTIVQWMKDPAVVYGVLSQADIQTDGATLRNLSKTFLAEKLSTNYIQVRFQVVDTGHGETISQGIEQVLKEKIEGLNQQPKSENWFTLVYSKPIITQARISLPLVTVLSVIGGFLVAVMSVLVIHYWRE